MGGLARWSFFLQALPSERFLPEPATPQHQMQVTCSTIWVQTESLLLRARRSIRRPGWKHPGKQPAMFKGAFSSSNWKQLLSIWAEYQQSGGLHPPGDKSQVFRVCWHPLRLPTPFTTTHTHMHTHYCSVFQPKCLREPADRCSFSSNHKTHLKQQNKVVARI